MLDDLKQAALIWKLIAFIGIPLAGLFACGTIGATLYLVLNPRPTQVIQPPISEQQSNEASSVPTPTSTINNSQPMQTPPSATPPPDSTATATRVVAPTSVPVTDNTQTGTSVSTPVESSTTSSDDSNQEIAYVRTTSRAGGEYDIYVSDANGNNARQLTNLPGLETSPSWSLDGQKIAFVATQDSTQPNDCATGYVELKCNFEIYTINIDGTNLKRLTTLPAYDRDPTWSSDGQKVVFSSREPGAQVGYIFVINADGTGLTQLTDGFVRDTRPNWSPDGQKIAFSREICCEAGTSALDVYVMNADGTNVTRLTDDGDSANPAWSPDGQHIAWTTFRDETGKLGIMNADGSDQTIINLDIPVVLGYRPAWSPDSQQLLFVYQQGSYLHLYRVNRDGTNPVQITSGAVFYSAPAWSPFVSEP